MISFFLQLPGGVTIPNPPGFTGPETLGGFISALLPYLFIISGLILFGAIIFSGFNLALSGGSPDKVKSAKGCLTNALIGFIVILCAYWIIQILQYVLGIQIF